jgi:hypothetical protein
MYQPECSSQPNRSSDHRKQKSPAEHCEHNLACFSTQRHTNSDLARALGDDVRNHPVDPQTGQQQCQTRKAAEKQSEEPRSTRWRS